MSGDPTNRAASGEDNKLFGFLYKRLQSLYTGGIEQSLHEHREIDPHFGLGDEDEQGMTMVPDRRL